MDILTEKDDIYTLYQYCDTIYPVETTLNAQGESNKARYDVAAFVGGNKI